MWELFRDAQKITGVPVSGLFLEEGGDQLLGPLPDAAAPPRLELDVLALRLVFEKRQVELFAHAVVEHADVALFVVCE